MPRRRRTGPSSSAGPSRRRCSDPAVDLAAGRLLERVDPVDVRIVAAVLGVPGPVDEVQLPLALPEALLHGDTGKRRGAAGRLAPASAASAGSERQRREDSDDSRTTTTDAIHTLSSLSPAVSRAGARTPTARPAARGPRGGARNAPLRRSRRSG